MLKTNGFTLMETMIALGIVIILAVAAVPSFLSLYREYHLNTTTQNMYYVLQYAKSVAIKNNQSVYVNFRTGDGWCYGVKAASTCDCNTAGSCTLANYSASQAQDLSLSTTGLSSNTLIFDGTHGSASVSTITFTIYNDNTTSMGVSIGALGNMKVCSNSVSGYPACS